MVTTATTRAAEDRTRPGPAPPAGHGWPGYRPSPLVGDVLVLLVAGTVIWFVFLSPFPRWDLLVFLEAGKDVRHGLDPYPPLASAELYAGKAFVYPIVAVLPFVPLSALPTAAAGVVFYVGSLAAVWAAVRLSGNRTATLLAVLLAATTIRGLQVGSINALLLLGLVLCWRFRDRPLHVAAVAAAVIVSKLFAAPILLWLIFSRRWKAAALTAGLTAGLLGAGWLFGPLSLRNYTSMLKELTAHEAAASWSLTRLLWQFGVSRTLTSVLVVGAGILVLAMGIGAVRRGAAEELLFTAAVISSLVLSPIVWSHYFLLAFAPLLVMRARLWAYAVAAAASWAIAPPTGSPLIGSGLGGRYHPGLRWAFVVLALAVVAVHLTRQGLDQRRPVPQQG